MQEYIYLIYVHESRRCKDNIYKLGKSTQAFGKRTNSYPKGSLVLCQVLCNGCDVIEKLLIEKFHKEFKHCPDKGDEYFEGDPKKMARIIFETCLRSFDNARFEMPCECDVCPKQHVLCANPRIYEYISDDDHKIISSNIPDFIVLRILLDGIPDNIMIDKFYDKYVEYCTNYTKKYALCEPIERKEFLGWARLNFPTEVYSIFGFGKKEVCFPYRPFQRFADVVGVNNIRRLIHSRK